jgi:hypothetical protein
MDSESRLQKIEAQVHQIRILVWVALALVLAIGLGFLLVAIKLGLVEVSTLLTYIWFPLVVLILVAMVCLLVFHLLASVLSGLRQFRTSREADAQIFRQVIAGQAKDRSQDPGL